MYNETEIYSGDGVPTTGNLLNETVLLLRDLKEIAQKEDVSIDTLLKAYECKVREYNARMIYQCADSEQSISNSISNKNE